ncbi:MAG: hypothetical protein IME94_01025 [Proteobacteria bacterium]|nr:hypothetical protein [Pseudomonadota bacterium]
MREIIKVCFITFFYLPYIAIAQQSIHTDSASGAISWETHVDGVHFSLTQILPEQVQAFYVNRGFTLKQIEPYSSSCVYMTVLRNDNAPGTIHFISNNWSVSVDGQSHPLVSVNEWVQLLTTNSTKKSSLVAFRWAQFPPEQEYEPGGDWNQGMFSIGLDESAQFDIIAQWDIEGKKYEAKLQGVQCAK